MEIKVENIQDANNIGTNIFRARVLAFLCVFKYEKSLFTLRCKIYC